MRLFCVVALGSISLSAFAQAPHPPAYPPPAPAGLREPDVPQPEHPFVITVGDFDGDGRPDTIEKIPGAHDNSLRVQVRLAAHPDHPFMLFEGTPAERINAMDVMVGPAGVYIVDKMTRDKQGQFASHPDPTAMPHDVVLVKMGGPYKGYMLKYWAASTDGFVGVNWPDASGVAPGSETASAAQPG